MARDPSPASVPGWLKSTLELGPVLGFFVVYLWLKDDVFVIGGTPYKGLVVVTALFIPVLLAAMAVLWRLTGRLSPMQVLTAVLVVVFGGLTVWLNDERFIKIKPTIVNGLLGAILLIGLARGRSLLAVVLSDALKIDEAGWMTLTRRFMWFFLGSAAANEIVWRTMSTEIWVSFETFVLPGAIMVFFLFQARLISEHGLPDDADDGDGDRDQASPPPGS